VSRVYVGKNIECKIKSALDGCAFTVTDDNVARIYPEFTRGAYVIEHGEKNKNKDVLFDIIGAMSDAGLTRGDRIAAVGGGVVGDMAGLAAALYMRGIDWVCVPTTLLAMADSCIGGKTAVDFRGVKNLAGAFHSPREIYISARFADTLADREFLCGFGEMIKTSMLDPHAYELMRKSADGLLAHDFECVYALLNRCVEIKKRIVKTDPKEKGLRKILNVGHTVGHALESVDGFRLSHGEYVLKGMIAEFSMCKYHMPPSLYGEAIGLMRRFTVPPRTSGRAVCETAVRDKKNTDGKISLMVPVEIGRIEEVRLFPDEFISRYDDALKELKEI